MTMKDFSFSALVDMIKERLKEDVALAQQQIASNHVIQKVSSTDWADMLKMHLNQVNTLKPYLQLNAHDVKTMLSRMTKRKKQKINVDTDDDENDDDDDSVKEKEENESLYRNDNPRTKEAVTYPTKHCSFCQHETKTRPILSKAFPCTPCPDCYQSKKSLTLFFESIVKGAYDFSDEEIVELEIQTLSTIKNIISKRACECKPILKRSFQDAAVACANYDSFSEEQKLTAEARNKSKNETVSIQL